MLLPVRLVVSVTRGDGGRTGDKELVLELVFCARDLTPGPTMRLLERSHVKAYLRRHGCDCALCCDGQRAVIGRVFLRQCGGMRGVCELV